MRILFAGTPSFTIPLFKMLATDFKLCGVLTNPPAPKGRSKRVHPSDIAEAFYALQKDGKLSSKVRLFEPNKIDDDLISNIQELHADLLVCFAYGKFFTPKFLSCFAKGGVNIHPSLLPRWRGATPVPAAILNGDKLSGVSLQTISNQMDSGNILDSIECEIGRLNAGELLEKLSKDCVQMVKSVLLDFDQKLKNATIQNNELATFCTLFDKNAGLINWAKSAKQIDCLIRAVSPKPGAFSYVNKERINIIEANTVQIKDLSIENSLCELTKVQEFGKILGIDPKMGIIVNTGSGVLAITRLQRQSKKPLYWKDFLNGFSNFKDLKFDV